MKTNNYSKNNSGISTLFVISSMFVTMFIGTAMLKMSVGGQLSNVYYNSSESARQTVNSGMIEAIHDLESIENNVNTLALLQEWIDSKSNNPFELTSGSLSDDGKFQYKVELRSFDPTNFNVALHATGTGKGDSRAHMTSIFNLKGLEYKNEPVTNLGTLPACAIQIDNGNFEFNCELIVDGNTQVFEKMTGNNGPYTFNGNYRIDPHRVTGNIPETVFNKGVTITGNAYFGGAISCYGNVPLTIHGKAAFEDDMVFYDGKFDFFGSDIWFNGNGLSEGTDILDLRSANIHYNNNRTYHETAWGNPEVPISTLFTTTGSFNPSDTEFKDLYDSVEVFAPSEKIFFDYQSVLNNAPNIITVPTEHTVSDEDLATWYDEQLLNGQLYKDKFVVIHFPSDYKNATGRMIDANSTPFAGKAIIIVEARQFGECLLSTTDDANVALYLHSLSNFDPKLKDFSNFRGIIYINEITSAGYAVFDVRQVQKAVYKGTIYAGENARVKFDGGRRVHHIIYDQDVVTEFYEAGIFSSGVPSEETVISNTLQLNTRYTHIEADLISQSI